ncbi:MAG: chemotaxis protein CheD [Pseudomonadota bacterium]
MAQSTDLAEPSKYFLQPGYIYLPDTPTVISTVLGSCVSVCIFDRKRKSGGMNHFRFPITREREKATADYGNVATLALINMMTGNGTDPKHLEAQIIGGAYNPDISSEDIGRKNVWVARKVLVRNRIRIVSEDTGGSRGRKVVFHTLNNEVGIFKVENLRKGDWAPYASER